MSGRKIMSIIGIVLMGLLIGCLFLPFVSFEGFNESLWEFNDAKHISICIVLLLVLIVGVLIFVLQLCGVLKDAKAAYFSVGYYFSNCVWFFLGLVTQEGFEFSYMSFGFYLGFISSIALIAILAISGLMKDGPKKTYGGYAPQKPIGFDPQTGKPIYDVPRQIVGYDPQTGKPIYQ